MLHPGDSILVSACLLGVACRYDSGSKPDAKVLELITHLKLHAIPVCPEQLGGLPTPRPASRFVSGDGAALLEGCASLINENGEDVGEAFRRGAKETLTICRLFCCKTAILKERSPSCGSHKVWVDGLLVRGTGVTAALLAREGIVILSNENLPGVDRQ